MLLLHLEKYDKLAWLSSEFTAMSPHHCQLLHLEWDRGLNFRKTEALKCFSISHLSKYCALYTSLQPKTMKTGCTKKMLKDVRVNKLAKLWNKDVNKLSQD